MAACFGVLVRSLWGVPPAMLTVWACTSMIMHQKINKYVRHQVFVTGAPSKLTV